MRTLQLQINKINDALCVKFLVAAICAVAFMYVYMVNSIAFNAAAHEDIVGMAAVLQSQIGQLESDLISENRKIEKSMAIDFGLTKTVENEAKVVLRDSNTRLTLNE
jgi:hypothetical protein